LQELGEGRAKSNPADAGFSLLTCPRCGKAYRQNPPKFNPESDLDRASDIIEAAGFESVLEGSGKRIFLKVLQPSYGRPRKMKTVSDKLEKAGFSVYDDENGDPYIRIRDYPKFNPPEIPEEPESDIETSEDLRPNIAPMAIAAAAPAVEGIAKSEIGTQAGGVIGKAGEQALGEGGAVSSALAPLRGQGKIFDAISGRIASKISGNPIEKRWMRLAWADRVFMLMLAGIKGKKTLQKYANTKFENLPTKTIKLIKSHGVVTNPPEEPEKES